MNAIEGDGAPLLRISADRQASTLVVVLEGELDLSNVESLHETLSRELEDRPEQVVFDLAQLRFMDSSGIAALIRARKEIGPVTLRSPSDIIRRVIVGTGLAGILAMEP